MQDNPDAQSLSALREFRIARLHADFELIYATLTGKSADLLSYEDVRRKVKARETARRQLRDIPLDAIVGSVGRYTDFTRRFLPRTEGERLRWARVRSRVDTMQGLPPIEVFQIGDVYFVSDGNHRASVARELGQTHIEAYVVEVETKIQLAPDTSPDDLIIAERYLIFLERTKLDEAYPDLNLRMTAAGNYRILEQQIEVHQHWVEEHNAEALTMPEAAARWYEFVYWPVVQVIRQRGMLRDFPGRTETDLYVWIHKKRHEMTAQLGWSVDAQMVVTDLLADPEVHDQRRLQRARSRLRHIFAPDALDAGPMPGAWRKARQAAKQDGHLFSRVLVAVNGQEDGWQALAQAIDIAKRENGRVLGLHVIPKQLDETSSYVANVGRKFDELCRQGEVMGELSLAAGPASYAIADRARWADLVVVSLAHPPGTQAVARLSSRFGRLLRRCPRPILALPRVATPFNRLLLAYDGSPKADEAMYVAAYLAGAWAIPLDVVTVRAKHVTHDTEAKARQYLDALQPTFINETGKPADVIMHAARTRDCDLIIMGGYGAGATREIMLGSVVDTVLRTRNRPVLICR